VRKLAVVLHLSIQRRFLNGQRLEIVRITGFHLKLLRLRVTVGISRAHVPCSEVWRSPAGGSCPFVIDSIRFTLTGRRILLRATLKKRGCV
jgi:hypothetical protein